MRDEADLVIEAPVEGDVTRYSAVFLCQATIGLTGPIRSARYYNVDLWQDVGVLTVAFAALLFSGAIFVCFAGSLLFGIDSAAWLLPLSGLFMSILYPTLNSKGISCFPKAQHGAAAGVILFFTAVAAAAGPFAMGVVSDAYGSTEAGFVLATAFAFLLFAGLVVNWLLDPSKVRLGNADREDYDRDPALTGE
jgi:MFS family permease